MTALFPPRPTRRDVSAVADEWGFALHGRDASLFAELIGEGVEALSALEPLLTPAPPDRVRAPANVLGEADNPLGAWAYRCALTEEEDGPLAGFDVAVKDSIAVAGVPMQNGSQATAGFVPTRDAVVVRRVLEAGGRIVGKAQCEDFCQGAQSFTSWPEPVRNPHDPSRSAGGSSSGSAALVGGGVVPMAIGGDSAGSIRVPSAYCGVVGLKPTFGAVPFTGAASLEMSLEHLGPITKTVAQNERLFAVLAGPSASDPRKCAYADRPRPLRPIGRDQAPRRIAIMSEGFGREGSEAAVDDAVRAASFRLGEDGLEVATVDSDLLDAAEGVHLIIYLIGMARLFAQRGTGSGWLGAYPTDQAEALPDWLSRRDALPDTLVLSLLAGRYLDQRSGGDAYARAQNARWTVTAGIDRLLGESDVLLLPTATTTAPPFPDRKAKRAERLLSAASAASNAPAFNLTGHPALSVPCGEVAGLPVGAMLVARHGDEAALFDVARTIEAQNSCAHDSSNERPEPQAVR